jgi:hypothetical protein
MTHWVQAQETSRDRAGFVQWYLCDHGHPTSNAIVGEVVQISDELGTYYAELCNGRGLRYFTDVDVAKDWLWSFYVLERASCD